MFPGDDVVLVVSKGPELIDVPEVAGLPAASRALARAESVADRMSGMIARQIGRASCRERV